MVGKPAVGRHPVVLASPLPAAQPSTVKLAAKSLVEDADPLNGSTTGMPASIGPLTGGSGVVKVASLPMTVSPPPIASTR